MAFLKSEHWHQSLSNGPACRQVKNTCIYLFIYKMKVVLTYSTSSIALETKVICFSPKVGQLLQRLPMRNQNGRIRQLHGQNNIFLSSKLSESLQSSKHFKETHYGQLFSSF